MRTGLQVVNKGLAAKYRKLAVSLRPAIHERMADLADEARGDFAKTVTTWNDPPEFEVVERERSWTVATDDERYLFVDQGTRPHLIAPKNKPFLAFRGDYQAKTTPRVIASRPGGPSGPTVFTMKPVHHPGTEARNFTDEIFQKYQKQVLPAVRTTIRNEIRGAGLEAVGT